MDRAELQTQITELIAPRLKSLKSFAGGLGIVGLVLSVIGFLSSREAFFQAYLVGYLFWAGASLGALGLLMLHHTVGGGWGWVLRRFLEAATRVLPIMLILFAPIALAGILGVNTLYWAEGGWANASAAADPIIHAKSGWLNYPGFVGRTIAYFAIWIVYGNFLRSKAKLLDERHDPRAFDALNRWAAFGLVVMVITVTFASVDWVMSLTPHWLSSIIGLLFCAAFCLTTMALLLTLVGHLGGQSAVLEGTVSTRFFRDLGNFMLAMVMLWGYMTFSQYLIIYSGNLAEEVPWYINRARNGWGIISLGLIVIHWAVPFFILLVGSATKRSPSALRWVALWIVLARFVDLYWWVVPNFRSSLADFNLADLGAPMLLGGIWLTFWANGVESRPLVSAYDPRIEANLHEVVSHHG
jgi:hypothetical protein